ncbi:MAG: hypothetical protein GY850_03590 [bacterium]|nr:hypothetical protein [bacterium]
MPPPWLSRAVIQNGALKVQIRRPASIVQLQFWDSLHWFNFSCFRRARARGNTWNRVETSEVRQGMIVITSTSGGRYRGYLLGRITNATVQVHALTLSRGPRGWQAVVAWQSNLSLERFASDIYILECAASLQMVATLAIVVAVVTGIAIGAGFGPLAGAFGVAAEGGATVAVIVSGIAGAVSTFIHQNFEAMKTAVRDDPENGAAHYYRANSTDFGNILTNSLISGTFSAGTTGLIPGPSGISSFRDLIGVLVNRIGNAFAGIVQNIVSHMLTDHPRPLTEQQIRTQLRESYIRDLVIRCLG